MSPTEPGADQVEITEVDARGLRCPLPVIRLAQAAKALPAGSRVAVLATDPAARIDVGAWSRMRGHGPVHIEDFETHFLVSLTTGASR